MPARLVARQGLPAVSQPIPLDDFPPFVPIGAGPRALTPAESIELLLRAQVSDLKKSRLKTLRYARYMRAARFGVVAATIAVLALPTIGRMVLPHTRSIDLLRGPTFAVEADAERS